MQTKKNGSIKRSPTAPYSKILSIDGNHPLKESVPNSYVEYQVRSRKGGKIYFFNFSLAKEMGLIPEDHPEEMNQALEKVLLDTFSIVIINEYDIEHKKKFNANEIHPNKYMATRYLQLQHPNKQGKTSGDGRSIWNGFVEHKGRRWDISSCGTGATCLSPATHIEGRFFQTGDPKVSYGCGYAELDEGLGTLFFSEVFHSNNISTERVLGIIDYGDNLAITIRTHDNLIRPSHFFRFLKQSDRKGCQDILDYYIARQESNRTWKDVPKVKEKRYQYFLQKVAENFGKTAAKFEDDYIFCWMDWDGDNILMDGGIIDYGSVRQFGLFHHEYRYDDDTRYSTSIVEQKKNARYTVQTFIQLVDFVLNGSKQNIAQYFKHPILNHFDSSFEKQKDFNIVYKIGFGKASCEQLVSKSLSDIRKFRKSFSYFERAKSVTGIEEVADGINWNAIYCMRDILRELPQLYLARQCRELPEDEFIEILKSNYATKNDLAKSRSRSVKVRDFQRLYNRLIASAAKLSKVDRDEILITIGMRSSMINKYDRVTGDSITTIVDKVQKNYRQSHPNEIYHLVKEFTEYQILNPDLKDLNHKKDSFKDPLMRGILKIVRDYREGL